MSISKDEAKQKVAELVAKYESLSSSQVKAFNEANTKQSFIEPLFKALGWDVDDADEVTLEEKASSGRVDYAFKLHGVSQFYLESKSLKADLTNPDYIKQAITYAYNKGVTWVVLTDFEGLRLFNAQANKSFITLKCQDYLSAFDKLWLLSHESLAEGLLNKEAAQSGALPATLPVEMRLFRQLRQWREDLFNQLHLYNKELTFNQIDEVIQRLFDRLIFIRTCEDRGIEEKRFLAVLNQWKTGGRKGELIEPIRQIFSEFDGYYDSDLFAHHIIDSIFIMGTTLEQIITGLYEVPGGMANYDFSIIDADVLGIVYEQYLGHVAQVVKQRAKEAQIKMDLGVQTESITLIAKKERRKEQGIYYTPKFVTDYIVKETVGRFITEHAYNEICNIKILDPACGSGSFLIRAYDELLDYHANQQGKHVVDLNQWDRLKILTGNIFGVDLDIQAIEIARLNLLLRSLAKREILPSLKENIRQGNSLISGTEALLKSYFGDKWRDEKPFNWDQEFDDVMDKGGFDVVIGNPPWVFTRDVDFGESMKRYFSDLYEGASGKVNSFALFIWRGVNLLKPDGLFSMIVPNTFLRATTYESLRRNLLEKYSVMEITDAGPEVFPTVTASTVILVIKKGKQPKKIRINTLNETGQATALDSIATRTALKTPAAVISIYADDTSRQIITKVNKSCNPLATYAEHLISGIQTWKQHKSNFIANKKLSKDYKPLLEGKDIGRYQLNFADKYILYSKDVLNVMQDKKIFLLKDKILIQRVSGGTQPIKATLDTDSFYTFNSINTLVCRELDNRYVLGCLNSKFMNWFYYTNFTNHSALTVNIAAKLLRSLPIPPIDFNKPPEKKMHNALVGLVKKILGLHKKLAAIRDTYSNERDEVLKDIKNTDREIDTLVYELYELTEEEKKIIEAST